MHIIKIAFALIFSACVLLSPPLSGTARAVEDYLPEVARGHDDADWINNDYFDTSKKGILFKVEWAHLHQRNFWRKYNNGQLNYAMEDLKYVLWVFPNHPKGLQMMGAVCRLLDMPLFAIHYFARAIDMYPQYAITHAQYGSYLVDIGSVPEGIKKLQQAVDMDPGLAVARAWIAKAYHRAGKNELAAKEAATARKLGFKGNIEGEAEPDKTGKER